jgi:conjugal transfer pilus assembly protein TraK
MYARLENLRQKVKQKLLYRVASFTCIAFALVANAVEAAQLVRDADKRQVEVSISAKEPNSFVIEGRSLEFLSVRKGVLRTTKDGAGVVYAIVQSDEPQTISAFVTDDEGARYHLLLVPKPIPSQDVVIVPSNAPRTTSTASTVPTNLNANASKQQRIKSLIFALQAAANVTNARIEIINQEVPLWNEARLIHQGSLQDGPFVGELFELTNVSSATMQIAEQELMRPGVVAIAMQAQTLRPNESTSVFVVRER